MFAPLSPGGCEYLTPFVLSHHTLHITFPSHFSNTPRGIALWCAPPPRLPSTCTRQSAPRGCALCAGGLTPSRVFPTHWAWTYSWLEKPTRLECGCDGFGNSDNLQQRLYERKPKENGKGVLRLVRSPTEFGFSSRPCALAGIQSPKGKEGEVGTTTYGLVGPNSQATAQKHNGCPICLGSYTL